MKGLIKNKYITKTNVITSSWGKTNGSFIFNMHPLCLLFVLSILKYTIQYKSLFIVLGLPFIIYYALDKTFWAVKFKIAMILKCIWSEK